MIRTNIIPYRGFAFNAASGGDFTFECKSHLTGASRQGAAFGVFDAAEIGTFDADSLDGDMYYMTNSWWLYLCDQDVRKGSAKVQDNSDAALGAVILIERDGTDLKFNLSSGTYEYTFTDVDCDLYLCFSGYASYLDLRDVKINGVSTSSSAWTGSANVSWSGDDVTGSGTGAQRTNITF